MLATDHGHGCLPNKANPFILRCGHLGSLELRSLTTGRDRQGEFSFLQNGRIVELLT